MMPEQQTDDHRHRTVSLRLTDTEYAQVCQDAWRSGLSLSELCRRHILGRRVTARTPQIDAQGIALLRQIGGLCKQIWQASRSDQIGQETWALLQEAKRKLHSLVIGHQDQES